MKLHADLVSTLNVVTAYGDDYIEVNRVRYANAVSVAPEGAVREWPVHQARDVDLELLRSATGLESGTGIAEVLLIGTGSRQQFLSPAVVVPLMQAGIGVEMMGTHAAARTYNILMAEGRRVVALLLPPHEEATA